ncbi:ABC transporter [Bacillus sp. ISL-75]|uniref:ABC transporter n=1 Tax=Bacillus sp. ISL-75 TaxID=2819137 RepID=UPI001BE71EDC|nr:ABC transporter [Bacillus sp. ISL-75]MBT2726749.1 ABC transporter [Bacillus sp. ISL-75]
MIKTDSRLLEIYVGWENKLEKDEWYFSNSFESITKGMSSEEAFNYIPNVIDVLFNLDDDYLIWETLYFLMELYSIADTTQVHPYLECNLSVLKQHIKKYEDSYDTPFQELIRHIRIRE